MKNSLLGKIFQNHPLAMILCCAIPLALIVIFSLTGSLGSWGYYALFLLCPLLHVFMMRGHGSHGGSHAEEAKGDAVPAHEDEGPLPSPEVADEGTKIKREPLSTV